MYKRQEQYYLIRGEDVSNPVIIWIHGGPASPDTMETYAFSNYLKDDYTVAVSYTHLDVYKRQDIINGATYF